MSSMMTPLSVQFTLEQRDWLDARTRGGVLSRSSVIRLIVAEAMAATRDLVNTPAEQMGPGALAEAVRLVAQQHGAKFRQVVGDELLAQNFPAIHAVGRAADAASGRAPRLIELTWEIGRAHV